MQESNPPGERQNGMTDVELDDVEERASPRARIIYEIVRRQGDEELDRPPGSLFWSGIAGGITIMMSVIAQAALAHKLPADMPGRQPVAELGYSLGFVMVILGRMQLFTEQTIVTVLPIMAAPGWRKLGIAVRLWIVVFVANMAGSCTAAALNTYFHLVSPELLASMLEVSGPLLHKAPLELLLQAIPAGFLVASIAWIRAGTAGGELWIVVLLTYAIALGGFAHVVAGSAEAFLLLFAGQIGVGHALGGIIGTALVGNVIGGTGLFALLAHAQVRQEM
jgi:formate/nitrite transporter FocA (FNT family)